jgi:hypothetical protein
LPVFFVPSLVTVSKMKVMRKTVTCLLLLCILIVLL